MAHLAYVLIGWWADYFDLSSVNNAAAMSTEAQISVLSSWLQYLDTELLDHMVIPGGGGRIEGATTGYAQGLL